MPRSRRRSPQVVNPVDPSGKFARVDQGVDWEQNVPYKALGDGVVYAIGGFARGEGVASHTAIYIRLDHPIRVNGRVYDEVYYAESAPLVKVGDRVKAGQAVMAAGGSEIGFANGEIPMAPLVGGLGGGTQASMEGHDFLDLIQGKAQVDMSANAQRQAIDYGSGGDTGGRLGPGQTPGGGGGRGGKVHGPNENQIPSVLLQDQQQPFSPQESIVDTGATGLNDMTGLPIGQAASLWREMAQQQNASPETRLLAGNADQLLSGIPSFLH